MQFKSKLKCLKNWQEKLEENWQVKKLAPTISLWRPLLLLAPCIANADRIKLPEQVVPKNISFTNRFLQLQLPGTKNQKTALEYASLEFTSIPENLTLREEFVLTATVASDCAKFSGYRFVVDMPQHGHGLTDSSFFKQMQIQESDGRKICRFQVLAAEFHMPGWWRFCLQIPQDEPQNKYCFHRMILK